MGYGEIIDGDELDGFCTESRCWDDGTGCERVGRAQEKSRSFGLKENIWLILNLCSPQEGSFPRAEAWWWWTLKFGSKARNSTHNSETKWHSRAAHFRVSRRVIRWILWFGKYTGCSQHDMHWQKIRNVL